MHSVRNICNRGVLIFCLTAKNSIAIPAIPKLATQTDSSDISIGNLNFSPEMEATLDMTYQMQVIHLQI